MEEQQSLAIHEAAELQSLLTFKNSCMHKIKQYQNVAEDDHLNLVLKSFMDKDSLHIEQLTEQFEKYDVDQLNSFEHPSTDEIIAYDLLMTAKTGVEHYAKAINEAPTYDIRVMLQRQLDDAIGAHEQIMNYMINKNWYHPYGRVKVGN